MTRRKANKDETAVAADEAGEAALRRIGEAIQEPGDTLVLEAGRLPADLEAALVRYLRANPWQLAWLRRLTASAESPRR